MCNNCSFVLNITLSPTLFSLKTQNCWFDQSGQLSNLHTSNSEPTHTRYRAHTYRIYTNSHFNVIEQLVATMRRQEKTKPSGKPVLCGFLGGKTNILQATSLLSVLFYQWDQCGLKTSGLKDCTVVHAQTLSDIQIRISQLQHHSTAHACVSCRAGQDT